MGEGGGAIGCEAEVKVPFPRRSRFGVAPRRGKSVSWKTARLKISTIRARQFPQRGARDELRNFVQAIHNNCANNCACERRCRRCDLKKNFAAIS
jgi:hypothetical protein